MTDHIDSHNLFHYGTKLHVANAVAAIIKVDDGRYLMQLRDDKQGIFYPDHWGLFGGAVDPGEGPEAALRRELVEELSLVADNIRYFTRMDFDFGALGGPLVTACFTRCCCLLPRWNPCVSAKAEKWKH